MAQRKAARGQKEKKVGGKVLLYVGQLQKEGPE